MISVIIVYKDDPYLWFAINALLRDTDHSLFEIIIVDDGSNEYLQCNYDLYPNVRVIRNPVNCGVGYSFDIGVKNCIYENIVLMGADVVVKDSTWFQTVLDYCATHKASIACSVCLSGDPEHLDPLNPADGVKRYGATIIPFATQEDIRSDSRLLEVEEYYVGAFDAQWIKKEPIEDISEVPCIYGAFYITTKTWYEYIHGWDTIKGKKVSGFSLWGGLEPWISLKNWLYGGKCHVIKELETLHVFHKYNPNDRGGYVPTGKWENFWYNKAFIAHTMLKEADAKSLLEKLYDARIEYELYTRQFNAGVHMIKKNWEHVKLVRDRNMAKFTHDFDWFCERFNIIKNF